jgi:Rrf2 family protein
MVTRAADYALRATLALACHPPGTRLCLNELADECDVPPAYLYKILQSMARSGLLTPHRGITGGYELTPRARDSSVLDVVRAVNGLPLLNTCVLSGACHRTPACPAHPVWKQAQESMREVLAGTRIADLARVQPQASPLEGRHPRQGRRRGSARERSSVEHGSRRPVPEGRRPRRTHQKRMEDR